MKYKIADLIVEYDAKYKILGKRSKKYLCENNEKTNIIIRVTEEEIKRVVENNSELNTEFSEYILVGAYFFEALTNFKGCLLHSSAVVVDNEAYLFSANCGTGKSTHTSLWMKYLKDKNPYILNDDKPAIRILEDGIYAYGTPFSGKHDMSENKKVKIKGICFLEQSETNKIRRLEPKEVINLFFEQTIRKLKKDEMEKLFDVLEILLKEIPFYKLSCNMSEDAVQLSYKTMRGELTNED